MKKVVSLSVFLLLTSVFIKAQPIEKVQSKGAEVVFPLSANPVIKEYLKRNPPSIHANRPGPAFDTLPFIDDFSKPVGIYPDASLWIDSGAFINSTFCDNPITVGVATLDGIDKNGNPYDINCGICTSIICDYLTSKPINLSGLTPGDSVYLSFYYQPQGLGDEPETGDSLVLQFRGKDVDTVWQSIWNHDGAPDTAFARVNINISDTNYLDSTFQFRFLNYATPNGNRDHWNIDYVVLDKKRSSLESLDELKDIGFINKPTSVLKEYESMPWTHYSKYASPASLFKTSFTDSIRNVWYSNATITYHANIDTTSTGVVYSFSPQTPNSFQNSVLKVTSTFPGNFIFKQDTTITSAQFNIKNYCDSVGFLRKDNDTTYYTQKFDNYYAYDDGSAEQAYGIANAAFAKMAYRFDLKMADTLRGIQIYFNPWGKDVHSDLIQICVWDSINVATNYEHLKHKQINNYVINIDSINGFATYVFDTSQYVHGRIYVGLIQNTTDLLGIGVDANTNSNDKMFINYNNHWSQSNIPASWMIRPFFGKDLKTGIDEQSAQRALFDIFPNPATNEFQIQIHGFRIGMNMEIYNVLGEKVLSKSLLSSGSSSIDASTLRNDVYFVRLIDKNNSVSEVRRLIVQH